MSFSFIQITDHHLPETETTLVRGFSPAYAFRAVMRHISQTTARHADFIFSTGDLVDPPTESGYRNLVGMLGCTDGAPAAPGPLFISIEGLHHFPLYILPGNHDERQRIYQRMFHQTPPAPLVNASFVHKGIQFVCLDWGDQAKAIAFPETLDFLSRSLQSDLPSIVVTHHHVYPIGSRWLDDFIADDIDRFWDIVRGQNVLGILCGHAHITYEKTIENIPLFGLRSTAFPFAHQDDPLMCLLPPHYRLLTVNDGALTSKIYEVAL